MFLSSDACARVSSCIQKTWSGHKQKPKQFSGTVPVLWHTVCQSVTVNEMGEKLGKITVFCKTSQHRWFPFVKSVSDMCGCRYRACLVFNRSYVQYWSSSSQHTANSTRKHLQTFTLRLSVKFPFAILCPCYHNAVNYQRRQDQCW